MEEKIECLEMAKALYQFKATIAKTLSFRESEYFIIYQASTKQRNWWQVINNRAQVGYVPSNYVISVQVDPEFIIKFVDECISIVRKESDKSDGVLPNDRQEVLLRLLGRKGQVEKLVENKTDSPTASESSLATTSCTSNSRISPPLLLHSQQRAKTIQSVPSLTSESEDEKAKGNSIERKSLSSLNTFIHPSTDMIVMKASGEVSAISGQVGIPLGEKKKAEPKNADNNSRRRDNNAYHKKSAPSVLLHQKKKSLDTEGKSGPSVHSETPKIRITGEETASVNISEEAVYQIVEKVRCNTELSHQLSRVAVEVVVSELMKYLNSTPTLERILNLVKNPIRATRGVIEDTHDAKRLNIIFSELTSCKNDAQQRSWMLHEDEAVIIDYVKELTSILMNADSNVSRHVISIDHYSGVLALIQYYQMETRWSIRQPLLQALGVLCSLDRYVINIFLTSILPMELARDMLANPRNVPKLNFSALLLTMIFSMGESMPITHLDHLGAEFVNFIFSNIEDPPDTDVEDLIPDLFVTLILSYNLQFLKPQDNIVLQTLSKRSVAKNFTEKVLLLLNREDDPVRIFDHEPSPPNAVIKLFIDLFSNSTCASLFYTNDVKVLIDIIVRQLSDLSPDNKKRHQYLLLCRVVMRNSGYSEHQHRREEISKMFTRIFCEEGDISLKDQQIVREISNEFPQYFK